MDRKIQKIYNADYMTRNDGYRNVMPFQNMSIGQNSIIPMAKNYLSIMHLIPAIILIVSINLIDIIYFL